MGQHTTQELTYQVGNQTTHGYLALPQHGEGPGIIVLHAWWGLTTFFKQFCDRLAAAGFVAFAPDLNAGKIAETVEEAEQIMAGRDWELTQAIAINAVTQLQANPHVQGNKLGVVGFSMGAAWSLLLATSAPQAIAAVVLFYGSTDDVDFGAASAAFLGHFAEHDDWEPREGVQQMEAAMRAAGRDVTLCIYPGTTHWFFEEDRQHAYNRDAAQLAWTRTITFLDDHLRQKPRGR